MPQQVQSAVVSMKLVHNILSPSGKPWVIHPAGQQPVYFDYNSVGDNTSVYSSQPDDWERNYTYDRLGRRLTYTEGELSESYTYNGSNLATHTQSWLENGNPHTKAIHYHYTAHRLDSVGYDDALSTIYHYDQYGRVDSLYDESGVVCYQYGNMGEVTQETRIYALPFLNSPLALTTQFRYDSWGCLQCLQKRDVYIFNFKIFHFVVKDIPVQIWYKPPDISSGTSRSPKMKMCDTTLSIVPHNCLVFQRHPVRKAIKKRVLKDIQYPFEIGDL